MYESLRPTNYLKDAANNTSLAPLDVGDGPAGTRVTGHNVCTTELVMPARKLHSMQAIRAANHVLQTADPSGINAAGPGSNVGQSVVYNYAGEILRTAYDRTGHPRYLAAIEEKAEKMLAVIPRYSDDLSHRIEKFFRDSSPQGYLAQNKRRATSKRRCPPNRLRRRNRSPTQMAKKNLLRRASPITNCSAPLMLQSCGSAFKSNCRKTKRVCAQFKMPMAVGALTPAKPTATSGKLMDNSILRRPRSQ